MTFSVIHTLAHCVNNLKFCNNFDEERKGLNLFTEKEKVKIDREEAISSFSFDMTSPSYDVRSAF